MPSTNTVSDAKKLDKVKCKLNKYFLLFIYYLFRSVEKKSMTEDHGFEHKWVPAPSKYYIKRTLTEPKTPFLSLFGKSSGREKTINGVVKKQKPSSIGPASYKIE